MQRTAPNLTNINGILVPLESCPLVLFKWVLPGLGECAIVADVTMPGEHIGQVSVVAILLVLDDRVEGDIPADLKLGLAEPGDLNNHVVGQVGRILFSKQGNIVPQRDKVSLIILQEQLELLVWVF